MNLWVCALEELWEYHGHHNPTHILTVIDEDVDVKYPHGVQTMRLNMFDVEYEDDLLVGVPKREHVQRIINFANSIDKKNDRILVHCWAGVSRSTAAALIILYIVYNRDIKQAISKLLEIRPQAAPNKLLCKYADEILNDGKDVLLREALKIEDKYIFNKGY